MRNLILLFLFLTHLPAYAQTTILSQGARNIKNASSYGGVSAVGDGVHDDTQAFLDAFNIGSNVGPFPQMYNLMAAVYVPPGNYLITRTLILWIPCFFFGEPSNWPTLILKSGSLTNTSSPAPFIVTRACYGHSAYDTNWNLAGTPQLGNGLQYAITQNTFHADMFNFNIVVQSNNAGCSEAVNWAVAQRAAVRNLNITMPAGVGTCFHSTAMNDGGGGGWAAAGITCNGGANALVVDQTAEAVFRGCNFNGPVRWHPYWLLNFIGCTFNDPNNVGFAGDSGSVYAGFTDCTFTTNTPFNCSSNYHFTRTTGLAQFSSGAPVYYNGTSVSGTDSRLALATGSTPVPNPAYPFPSSACVNVKSVGAFGDGSHDDTAAINNALATYREIYLPYGTYNCSATINVGPGQKIYGGAGSYSYINSTANPAMSVTGNGVTGVTLCNFRLHVNNSSATGVLWNGDPSSIALSFIITCANGTSQALYFHQSGGGFFEEIEPAIDSGGNAAICHQVTSTGPLYLICDAADHVTQAGWILSGASNVFIDDTLPEFPNGLQSAGNTVTNCTNINMDGMGSAAPYSGGFSSNYIWSISNSYVNMFGLFGVNAGGPSSGEIGENGLSYGGQGPSQFVFGYVDANPNATPTPISSATPTPTAKPTPTPTAKPTPTPTATPTPTPTAKPTPTPTAKPTPVSTPTPTPGASPTATPNIGYVQGNFAVTGTGASVGTQAVSFTKSEIAGNTNVVAIAYFSTSATVTKVTDSQGNVYQVASPLKVGTQNSQAIWYASNVKAGANTITAVFSSAVPYPSVRILEYHSLGSVDIHSEGTGVSSTATVLPVATMAPNEVIVGATVSSGIVNGSAPGFTQRLNANPYGNNIQDEYPGTILKGVTMPTPLALSSDWVENVVAFLPFGSSTPTPAYVQASLGVTAAGVGTQSASFSKPEVAGDINFVAIAYFDTSATITNVTDTQGNTYQVASPLKAGTQNSQAIWYARNVQSGANAITAIFSTPVTYPSVRIAEYSGLGSIDSHVEGTGVNAIASVTGISTTNARDMIFGATASSSLVTGAAPGFTERLNANPYGSNIQDNYPGIILTGVTMPTPLALSADWIENVVAFH